MISSPPADAREAARLADVRRVDWNAAAADGDIAVLLRLAVQACGAVAGGVSVVEATSERVVVSLGSMPRTRPRECSLGRAVVETGTVIVRRTAARRRRGREPDRQLAGAPLRAASGAVLGAVWVVSRPHAVLTPETDQTLFALGRAIGRRLPVFAPGFATASMSAAAGAPAPAASGQSALDALLTAVGAGYWDWDLDRGEVAVSPRFAELLRLPPTPTVSPATLFAALDDPDLEVVHDALGHLFARRDDRIHVEFAVREPGGETTWVRLRGHVAAWSPTGQPARALGLAVDITADRRRDDERHTAQRLDAIGALTAGVAHELNTPLQVVSHNLDFLASQIAAVAALAGGEDAGLRRDVEDAIAESIDGLDRASQIVRALKEFSHQGRGRSEQIDVNRMLDHAITLTRHEWRQVAAVERALSPEPIVVRGIAYEAGQVFVNLILNAAHAIAAAGRGPGRIDVVSRIDGEFADIQVTDNGAGIPEDVQDQVFQPFFTTKAPGHGAGLGLAASRAIVERYGGSILFHSVPGRGTTFLVRLPRLGPAARAA